MCSWHEEPRIEDLLDDPIVHMLSESDGISEHELRRLVEAVRQRISADSRQVSPG